MEYNTLIQTILSFLIIFGVVVIAHEFGHYLLAKINGIKVVEFSVGMGPKLLKFKKGDTEYSLRLFPIGGACMFEGEDGLYEEDEEEQKKEQENPFGDKVSGKEGSFRTASVWSRIAVVVAGPIFNIVLAYLLSLIIVGFLGSDVPVVTEVIPGEAAEEAGLQVGDEIIRINGERIHLFREIILNNMLFDGGDLEVEYERGGERFETMITPQFIEETKSYRIGITGGQVINCANMKIFECSWYEVRYWLNATFKSLQMLVQGKLTRNDISGPVGIVQVIDETIEIAEPEGALMVVLNMVNIAVLISVNLGIMNLLPIPALDGGRLMVLLVEVIRRKPLPQKLEIGINVAGFVFLMLLTLVVLYNDIWKLFQK